MRWAWLTWVVILLAYLLVLTVVMPTPAEDCELAGGEWDVQLNHCFGRFPP